MVGDDGVVQECKRRAGIGRLVDFLSYPVSSYLKLAWDAVDLLEPTTQSVEVAFRKLGYHSASDFLTSLVGKTLVIVAANDPRRLLNNAPTAYATSASFGTRTVNWLGPKHAELTFHGDFMVVPFHEGVIAAAITAVGAQNPKVTGRALSLLDAVYEASWE